MFTFPILIFFSLISFKKKEDSSRMFIFIFILFFLFSSLRYNVGYDYRNYVLRIHGMPYFNQLPLAREFFSYALFWISHWFDNPQIFFAVNSFITNFLIFYTIYYFSHDKAKSVWVYLTFPMFFLNSLSIVRNFTAFALVFFSHSFILEKEFKKFLTCIILASLFHNSAIFVLPMYFLNDFKLTWKRISISIFLIYVSVPLIQILTKLFLPSYGSYVSSTTNLQAGRGTLLVLLGLMFLSIYYFDELLKVDINNNFYINSLFYSVVIYAVYHRFGHFSFRMTEYLYVFSILLIPSIYQVCLNDFVSRTKFNKSYVSIFFNFLFYLVFFMMYVYLVNVGGSAYYPYRWKLFKFFDPNYYIPFTK